MPRTALIIVDVQNDFLPSSDDRPQGALAVPGGHEVIPVIQQLLQRDWPWDIIIATQDYHPPGHISFASRHGKEAFSELQVTDARGKTYMQVMWPDHCVQGTKGSEIESELRRSFEPWKDKMKIVRKACYRDLEAYSGFEGYITEATDPIEPPDAIQEDEVAKLLRMEEVNKVVITGLAADFCAKQTTLDAIKAGFRTALLWPSTRGVFEEGTRQALVDIQEAGGAIIGKEGNWQSELRQWMSQ